MGQVQAWPSRGRDTQEEKGGVLPFLLWGSRCQFLSGVVGDIHVIF